jgi:exopolyphosphatase/guanosine-5'-triphosphate,3'-diphosphate pyrophosphatase
MWGLLSSLHALAAASVTPLLSSGMRQNGSLSLRAVLGGVVAVAAAVYYYLHLRRFSTVVRRAAFDIGSGYTKMLVADVKDGAIVGRVVLETEVNLAYKVDAQQSPDGSLSEAIQAEGLACFRELTAKALSLGATEATGIATEIFRKAPNGDAFLERLTSATGVRITRISQEAEARLG